MLSEVIILLFAVFICATSNKNMKRLNNRVSPMSLRTDLIAIYLVAFLTSKSIFEKFSTSSINDMITGLIYSVVILFILLFSIKLWVKILEIYKIRDIHDSENLPDIKTTI